MSSTPSMRMAAEERLPGGREGDGRVMREALLDEDVTIEPAHLRIAKTPMPPNDFGSMSRTSPSAT